MTPTSLRAERGAVLVVGLIVLALITLMVTAAFKFSTYNLKSVGNMQSHYEAVAAANKAIEQVIHSWDFKSPPTADQIDIDLNNDGTNDYTVAIEAPLCVKAIAARIAGSKGDDCIAQLDGTMKCTSALAAATSFNVLWDVPATATSASGTSVRVHQGISLSLSQSQCTAACPPASGSPCA
jgi:Tfp pilus assembly protein PilX